MIQINNIHLSFGGQTVFNDISCTFTNRNHIGLVGRNGSGKSTMLKAIAGSLELDSGSVAVLGGTKIAYMPQDIVLTSNKNIVEEAITAFEYLQEEDVPAAEAQAKKLLMGLGFSLERLEQSVNELSTGWKMRLVLAKLLLQTADFYLFDEPTNHLDIVAQEWFLNFLKSAKFGFLLVCHERAFLNKVCDQIFELNRGNGTMYRGNYDRYELQKAADQEQHASAYQLQQKEITQKKKTIERFRAKASKAKMAQSMMKGLNRIDLIDAPDRDQGIVSISFPPLEKSGRAVLRIQDITKSFNGKQLFHNGTFRIERGSKVALVAANGVGKTTLFNIITGKERADNGEVLFGQNVDYALFEQDQNISLDPKKTIWEEVCKVPTKRTDLEMRAFLGAFLFPGDDIYKKTAVLSGGEKNRVSMVKTLLQPSNFLLLDEPTNHLDIQSKDVLLNALKSYPGTILFVSHDRDFVNKLATHIIELTPDGTEQYPGNYDDFIAQKQNILDLKKQNASVPKPMPEPKIIQAGKNDFETNKIIRSIEQKIEKLEQKRPVLSSQLANYSYGTPDYKKLHNELVSVQNELEALSAEWETLLKG
jgi:ATP-binding cassette subfamily F protein 3